MTAGDEIVVKEFLGVGRYAIMRDRPLHFMSEMTGENWQKKAEEFEEMVRA
jgi:hypothetical protein